MSGTAGEEPAVRKGFVEVPHGLVHYRVAGRGPPVVLLHDSPRSSAMHVPLLRALGREFTAIALDTPGYGNSTPLSASPRPEIPDFARALAATLQALGLGRVPVYGFHTSSKTNLQLSIDHPERLSLAILDGLNLPPGGPGEAFIERYMRPLVIEDDGSHLASAWTRARDLHRFFPWFDHDPARRLATDLPDDAAMHAYALDFLMAGPHYADAYAAAMRYLATPLTRTVRARTVFMCRANDPLYVFLDALPKDLPPHCSIERLPADREIWAQRLTALFRESASGESPTLPSPLDRSTSLETRGYVDLPHGQLHVRRFGAGPGRPILLLHEVPGASIGVSELARALASGRVVYAPDLPGQGESAALPSPDATSYATALATLLERLGLDSVDVVAEFGAGAFALELASTSSRVHRIVLDGLMVLGAGERRELWKHYCPPLAPRRDGAHMLALWHRLRDQELAWPWYAGASAAARRRKPQIAGTRLHALTVELAKQLAAYGDAARAAIEHRTREALESARSPVVLLHDPSDVRDAPLTRLARRLRGVRLIERPPDTAARAGAMLQAMQTPG